MPPEASPQDRPAQSAKEVVTIRLDPDMKARLVKLASKDGHTVSFLIDKAVGEFLDRHGLAAPPQLRVRHARLLDTSILSFFSKYGQKEAAEALKENGLLAPIFLDGVATQWRRLPEFLNSRDTDLVESLNRSAFVAVLKKGVTPWLDSAGPVLQMFGGHCVFISRELFLSHFPPKEAIEFTNFRDKTATDQPLSGKDLSTRSLIAWAGSDADRKAERAEKLEQMWHEAVIACQIGTDYHIAVKRVGPLLAVLRGDDSEYQPLRELTIHGEDTAGDFRSGIVTGFSGSLLDSASFLANPEEPAYLLAGPSDLQIPSINVLAGRKGMFPPELSEIPNSVATSSEVGARTLRYWARAVKWFKNEVVLAEKEDLLTQILTEQFKGEFRTERYPKGHDPILILKSLMQTWVKWFSDSAEAYAFFGDSGAIRAQIPGFRTESVIQYYDKLCEQLHPNQQMTAPTSEERGLWKFSALQPPQASGVAKRPRSERKTT